MPAQEIQQPQPQQMEMVTLPLDGVRTEQPRPADAMTAEPVSMRGGGEGEEVCCGICAGLCCFECLNCCC